MWAKRVYMPPAGPPSPPPAPKTHKMPACARGLVEAAVDHTGIRFDIKHAGTIVGKASIDGASYFECHVAL